MKSFKALRPMSRLAVLIGIAALIVVGAVAIAADPQPAIQTTTPNLERQITNIDITRQQIRNYYGDPLGTGNFSPDSNYAKEASDVASDGTRFLDGLARQGHANHAPAGAAILLDVDDTTLATWNYEIFSNWAYNPTTNANYVLGELFPAVPGMVAMVNRAASQGYAIFFLTGRGAAQETATLGNLTDSDAIGLNAGYPHPTTARERRGRPLHQAGRRRLPAVPEGRLHGRSERLVHDDALQDRDAPAHRIAGLRHRRELRGPVQRPERRLRRPHVQAAEPELLPAVTALPSRTGGPDSRNSGPPAQVGAAQAGAAACDLTYSM